MRKRVLKALARELRKQDYTERELFEEFYLIANKLEIYAKGVFEMAQLALTGKRRGPKLAPTILNLGRFTAANIFDDYVLKLNDKKVQFGKEEEKVFSEVGEWQIKQN